MIKNTLGLLTVAFLLPLAASSEDYAEYPCPDENRVTSEHTDEACVGEETGMPGHIIRSWLYIDHYQVLYDASIPEPGLPECVLAETDTFGPYDICSAF